MEEETKTFIGEGSTDVKPFKDTLLWWEGEHIRIDDIQGIAIAERDGLPLTALYLHPRSPAWAEAAQYADEEDE